MIKIIFLVLIIFVMWLGFKNIKKFKEYIEEKDRLETEILRNKAEDLVRKTEDIRGDTLKKKENIIIQKKKNDNLYKRINSKEDSK